MATLRDIKNRIESVNSVEKITGSMKLIASVKLVKAERLSTNFLPYQQQMQNILSHVLSGDIDYPSLYSERRLIRQAAIVPISSDTGLCGAFNSTLANSLRERVDYYASITSSPVWLYPIGKEIYAESRRLKNSQIQDHLLADKIGYNQIKTLSDTLMELFLNKSVDIIELIYHHYASMSRQPIIQETYLPLPLNEKKPDVKVKANLYIVEPDKDSFIHDLLPKAIRSELYAAYLDSHSAEQAARIVSMQLAVDNADKLEKELNKQHNKLRQQAITSELLDIVSAGEASSD